MGLSSEGSSPSWETLSKWAAPPPDEVWNGAYWALLSSAFVHLAIWHVAFNAYWLWILGGVLERLIGTARWLLFFVTAAAVSSGAQLAFSGTTGLGTSGVVYAIFGFLWIARRRFPGIEKIVSRQTVLLFIAWLIGCVVATVAKVWEAGNAAHIAGLLFGIAVAVSFGPRPASLSARIATALLVVASLVPLFWCPWLFGWVANKAYDFQVKGDYRSAVSWYRRSLSFGRDQVWAMQNLALAYYSLGNKTEFASTLQRLRQLSPQAASEVEHRLGAEKQEREQSRKK